MVDFGSIGAGAAGGAVVAIVIRASDEFSDTFDKATEKMGGPQKFSVATTGSFVALGAGVAAAAGVLGDYAIHYPSPFKILFSFIITLVIFATSN